uniref:glucan 1,4-alpha-glucosidase n=1 Tax=Blastobotrys adeninivorans TaxID=409370 RepID=A0A060TJ22_BLAAD
MKLLLLFATLSLAAPLSLGGIADRLSWLFSSSSPSHPKPLSLKPLTFYDPDDKLETDGIASVEFLEWLYNQSSYSLGAIIDNIGGYGSVSEFHGAHWSEPPLVLPGAVVASPSKSDPDYFYQWTRDAAMAIQALVTKFKDDGGTNKNISHIIDDYVRTSYIIQRTDNPSGSFKTLKGLGEPKFRVDGSPFLNEWGRPQRDGPALRALAIMGYMRAQLEVLQWGGYSDLESLVTRYREVLVPDLDYVQQTWFQDGFDIWEEMYGQHYFTAIAQIKAMQQGARFARVVGDFSRADLYEKTAREMIPSVRNMFVDQKNRIVANVPSNERSGIDCSTLISAVHSSIGTSFSSQFGVYDEEAFTIASPEMLNTIQALIQDMSSRFQINKDRIKRAKSSSGLVGVAIGRYPGDVYDGYGTSAGNPWFLCTATVANALYKLAEHYEIQPQNSKLKVHELFAPLVKEKVGKEISRDDPKYEQVVRGLIAYGDSFMDVIREHQGHDGSMSEQFNRDTGYMQGARHLTWSYEAFWTATFQRNQTMKRVW